MKEWEAEYLAERTARHLRAMDKAERALHCMRDCTSPSDICTAAVRSPALACCLFHALDKWRPCVAALATSAIACS